MTVTPLHGLALVFLYFKDKRRIDPLALLVSATLIDLEPLYYFIMGDPLDHRIWHGFAASLTVYPILITIGVYMVERLFDEKLLFVYNGLRLKPNQVKYSPSRIYLCSLIGGVSHVLLDMLTHKNMPYVIYPIANGNPSYIGTASITVEIAVILFVVHSCLRWNKQFSEASGSSK